MRIATMQVYICEYCNKKLFRVPDMIKHEMCCSKNPENLYKCFSCVFLRRSGNNKSFFCESKNTVLHKKVAIYKKIDGRYPKSFEGSVEMPEKCELFEEKQPTQ